MKQCGDRIGRYLIEALIGTGGMGEVYEASDMRLERRVALKLLRSDIQASAKQRFLREAQAACAFEHPNAVVVFDAGEDHGEMFIAMELVRGKSLRSFVGDASVSIECRLRWMIDVARALSAAHKAALIHRDIKPDNVLVRNDGIVKVLDFGIARKQRPIATSSEKGSDQIAQMATLTAEGSIVGTPSYWAPEQLRGEEIDARADQFAWAVTMYELLAGTPPWRASDPLALLSRILTSEPMRLCGRVPGLAEPVETAVFRALSKQQDDRFPSIDEAADALEPFAGSPSSTSRHVLASASPSSEARATTNPRPLMNATVTHESVGSRAIKRRRTARWIGLVAVVVLAALALGFRSQLLDTSGSTSDARAEMAPPLILQKLVCKEATLRGNGVSPELAKAIGVGACARLAIDVGVDWIPLATQGARPVMTGPADVVEVSATLEDQVAEVTVVVGSRRSTARGASPMEALVRATSALAPQLAPEPRNQAEIAAWGATDSASAVRISRAWQRMLLDLNPDDQAAARELLKSDPESVWTQMIGVDSNVGGAEAVEILRKRALELTDKLPRGRALVMRASLLDKDKVSSIDEKSEFIRLMRQGYAEDPDDAEVACLVSRRLLQYNIADEGYAILDRLYERFPSRSIWAMQFAIFYALGSGDLQRAGKYTLQLRTIFPESFAWDVSVRYAFLSGNVDEARKATDIGRQLGMTGLSSGGFYAEEGLIWLQFAMLQPKAAREVARHMLGVPRDMFVKVGADSLIASYLMEGYIDQAQASILREIERHRGQNTDIAGLEYACKDVDLRLMLDRPLPSSNQMDWMQSTIVPMKDPFVRSRWQLRLAYLKWAINPKEGRQDVEHAIQEVEALCQKTEGDLRQRDWTLLHTLPVVRKLRGDVQAIKVWDQTVRAPLSGRIIFAFHAALALEAAGDLARAEEAYRLALHPLQIMNNTMDAMAARIKLAQLYRTQKRDAEAEKLELEVDSVWANADPGLREAIRNLH